MNLSLRLYQHDIIAAIRAEYRHGAKAPLLQSPTGSGKTVIYAYITEGAAKKNNRVLILEHRKELITQTSDALFGFGVIHGIIAPGHSMTHDLVQVASVQTLIRRLDSIYPPDLIIIDEAHHAAAGSWSKILSAFPNAKLLGVTATPLRLDGRGLGIKSGGFFDTLINGPTVNQLVEQGFLSPSVVYAPKTDLDLTGIRKRFGDFINSEINERIDKPSITGSAVEHYLKLCPGVPAIAFCASVAHAEHVAAQFNTAGIPARSIDGNMQDWERKYCINGLTDGAYLVLCSCDLISEGTDIPRVATAIKLRPTASFGLNKQQDGRVLRVFPGKDIAYILDHVGNVFRHGFPDDEIEWSLDGEKAGIRKANDSGINEFVQCENCYLVFHRSDPACPECGWVRVPTIREIEEREGELQELEKEKVRNHLKREVGKARTKEELEALAKQRGYKAGWVYNILRARERRDVVYDR